MALFQLDQVFSYQDANDIKKLWASATAPASPGDGEVWLDISTTPYKLKRYKSSNSTWETIAGMTNAELLAAIKAVDGAGSGLDADLLDGQEGSYYQNATNLNAGTIALARIPTTLTGKDADKLDGQEGSYYQNATNLNAGTVARTRMPTEIVYSDTDKTMAANIKFNDNKQVILGTDSDFITYFDGSNTILKSYLHGGKVYHQAENASGTSLDMLTLDPAVPKVHSQAAIISQMITQTIANNTVFDTGISAQSVGMLILHNTTGHIFANGAMFFIGAHMGSNYGITRMQGSVNHYGTPINASVYNIYAESTTGNVLIQNISGESVTFQIGFIGAYID